jgi:hypothetical protein
MSAKTVFTRSALFAAVTVLCAAGLLEVQGAAQADPACSKYAFGGPVNIDDSDGGAYAFYAKGDTVDGPATLEAPVGGHVDGHIKGGITGGRHVDLVFTEPIVGNSIHFQGDYGDDGIARGTVGNGTWQTSYPIACAQQAQGQQQAEPDAVPKQGPTVTTKPSLAGVTFTFTDRSGIASQCTYSSEGYTDGFNLPANGSADLFVPAIREFRQRTGTVTCDNGTSSPTSVNF